MATEVLVDELERIGTAAGLVWQYLHERGPATLSRLARDVDVPRDVVMQAVGWLAREGKITFNEGARSKQIMLT